MNDFYAGMVEVIKNGFSSHGELIFGIFVGAFVAYIFNFVYSTRHLRKAYEDRIRYLEDENKDLRYTISERLAKITVPKKDKVFFKNLRKHFWSNTEIKVVAAPVAKTLE